MKAKKTYPFKLKPRPHQVKALRRLLKSPIGGALFMPMRSGKTKVAIDYAGVRNLQGKVHRVIVICPLSVIGVWKREIAKNLPDECDIQWVIVNFEKLFVRVPTGKRTWMPMPNEKLLNFDADLVIVDESHKIGMPTSLQSKLTYKLGKSARYRLILTGTPWHRKPLLIFGQFKFLDESVFGSRWTAFKQKHAVWGGYGGHVLVKYTRLKEMRRKVRPLSFILKHVPSRPPVHSIIPIRLEESKSAYDDMAHDAFVQLSEGVLEAPIVLTKALRLAQITGGHVKNDSGKMIEVGQEKRRAFNELMEQFASSDVTKIIAFARFLPELKTMTEVAQEHGYKPLLLHGSVSAPKREQRIAEFEESDDPCIFISQVSAGSLGIDLSSATDTVFFSLPESLVDFDQASARMKKFKDTRVLTYHYLLMEDTVDEAIYLALKGKMDLVELLMKHPDLIQEG